MKKTLVALAAATAMCSASAASVTLYGVVDTGFAYNSTDWDKAGSETENSFEMASGQRSGSRFGMKGVEELGNGLTVGFVLESGISTDTGAMSSDGLFNRESSLFIEGSFGKFGMGRLSTLANDSGSTGIGGYFSSFGTGWGDVGCQSYMQAYRPTRMDNMVYYKTPNFAGAEVWLLYGMGDEETGTVENESSRDRYYAAAVTYNNGGLSLYGAVDVLNKATFGVADAFQDTEDDQITITAAVNYDCGFAKSYLGVHWFDNARGVGGSSVDGDWTYMANFEDSEGDNNLMGFGDANGWSVMLGVDVPVGNGTIKTTLGYLDASSDAETVEGAKPFTDLKRFMVGAGYEHYLSKRTTLYVGAGYIQDSLEGNDSTLDRDPSWVQVNCGLTHKF